MSLRDNKKPRSEIAFIKPGYFIWILILAGGYAAIQIFGLPHIREVYSFHSHGNTHDPFAKRYYTSCTYWGAYGRFTIAYPMNGKCEIFRFYTSADQE